MYMATGSPFETASPHQAIAVLLLVENSQPMSFIWPDLRDLYLTKLVDNIEKTTAPTPIISLVLESYPSQGTQASFPRQYNGLHEGLRDLRFNGSPDNKLNVAKISTGIDVSVIDSVIEWVVLIILTVLNLRRVSRSTSCPSPDHCCREHAVR